MGRVWVRGSAWSAAAARSTVAAMVLAGSVVGLLVGCSPDPAVSPSVSASPTLPAPMPSPAKPALWSDNGDAGAGAAAVWFVRDAYAYVRETNDTTDWQALSGPDCAFCQSTVSDAESQKAADQVSREGSFTVAVTRTQELNPLAYSVLVDYEKPPTTVYRLDGTIVGRTDGAHGQMLIVLHRDGSGWSLQGAQWFDHGATVPTASSDS